MHGRLQSREVSSGSEGNELAFHRGLSDLGTVEQQLVNMRPFLPECRSEVMGEGDRPLCGVDLGGE